LALDALAQPFQLPPDARESVPMAAKRDSREESTQALREFEYLILGMVVPNLLGSPYGPREAVFI